MTQRVAVIGAGLSGLACARELRKAGCYVDVFEQDRIIGGRIATARMGLTTFDHGAQYVTARSDRFKDYLDEVVGGGYAARWQPKAPGGEEMGQMLPWYVGTPSMASFVRPLAEGLRIHNNMRVHTIQRDKKGWQLWFDDGTSEGLFHGVAIAVPALEARMLLGPVEGMADSLSKVRMSSCWSVLVQLNEMVLPDQDVFSDMSEVIRWVARNDSKPGRRTNGDNIVIHASPDWSRETEDADPEVVANELWEEVSHVLSLPPVRPRQLSAYLWRHGLVDVSLGETYVFSSEHMVGCCGDWCLGRLAEHGFDSGTGLGKAMISHLF